MFYKDLAGENVSSLGLGMMRLPLTTGKDTNEAMRDGDNSEIDKELVEKMIDYAFDHGINYFDTAWGYHNGNSEIITGEILKKYERKKFFLASKFPGYDLSNMPKVKKIFAKQLEKCQVEYFDFYLIHNVCESNINEYLNENFGILKHLLAQKEAGKIKHLGFSAHGDLNTIKRFMNSPYGQYMEFCQLQLNYMDWHFQNCDKKIKYCQENNLPVIVMEPLRGGKLTDMSPKMQTELKKINYKVTPIDWAFRFTQSINNAKLILSGMSNMQQLKENIKIFKKENPLNQKEFDYLIELKDAEISQTKIPCTACNYCITHCPQKLPIPTLLKLYNEQVSTRGRFSFISPMYLSSMPKENHPDKCITCKSCEKVCPQKISISEILKKFTELLK